MSENSEPALKLPTPPPLRSKRSGPHVPYQICGYALTMDAAIAWADKYGVNVDDDRVQRRAEVLRIITPRVPSHRLNVVCDEEHDNEPVICFALGSNKNASEMRLSQNIKRIKKFQHILGTTEPPRWFKPEI